MLIHQHEEEVNMTEAQPNTPYGLGPCRDGGAGNRRNVSSTRTTYLKARTLARSELNKLEIELKDAQTELAREIQPEVNRCCRLAPSLVQAVLLNHHTVDRMTIELRRHARMERESSRNLMEILENQLRETKRTIKRIRERRQRLYKDMDDSRRYPGGSRDAPRTRAEGAAGTNFKTAI
ncbi:hypothetical protein OSTOST_06079, partial [Ostertagia ostertagi]